MSLQKELQIYKCEQEYNDRYKNKHIVIIISVTMCFFDNYVISSGLKMESA